MPIARQPAGTPTGGEFAPKNHAEGDIALVDGAAPSGTDHIDDVLTDLAEYPFDHTMTQAEVAELLDVDESRLEGMGNIKAHRLADFAATYPGDRMHPEAVVAFSNAGMSHTDMEDLAAEEEAAEDETVELVNETSGLGRWNHVGDPVWASGPNVWDEQDSIAFTASGTLAEVDTDYLSTETAQSVQAAAAADPGRKINFGSSHSQLGAGAVRVSVGLNPGDRMLVATRLVAANPGLAERDYAIVSWEGSVEKWSNGDFDNMNAAEVERVEEAVASTPMVADAHRSLVAARQLRAEIGKSHHDQMAYIGSRDFYQDEFRNQCQVART